MCRFVLYMGRPITLSSLITEPDHSLIRQSFQSRERREPLNGDGFGVAWYAPEIHPHAAQFRSITPAWNNQNLRHLARATMSRCVLAHVRAATPGLPVTETNAHPFVWGPYAFMHNGSVAEFARIKRALLDGLGDEAFHAIAGTTDSEHVFALFLDRLLRSEAVGSEEAVPAALAGAVEDVLALCERAGVVRPSHLNLAVSDGEGAAVCRFSNGGSPPSLHLHAGGSYHCEDGACLMKEAVEGERSVIVASEALSADPGWVDVPPGAMVVVRSDRSAEIRTDWLGR